MRRGFSLIEILVALVIMVLVSSGVMVVFQYQNKNMLTQREIAEMNLMAKGVSEEMSRTLRMAGGVLPPGVGGLKVQASGPERVTVVLNRAGGVDTTRADSKFYVGTLVWSGNSYKNALLLPVRHVKGVFTDSGYVVTTVKVPPVSYPTGTYPAPIKDTMIVLPVQKLIENASFPGLGAGAMVVVDGSWFADRWPWLHSVATSSNTFVYALDSVRYWHRDDTVFRKINRNDSAAYAVGIDSMRLRYMHPSGAWSDSLLATDPANQIQKARARFCVRTRHKDRSLEASNPSTRGYHFQTIETEVALRNASTLVNK